MYSDVSCFDTIENDIIELSPDKTYLVCLAGDFNGYSKDKIDCVDIEFVGMEELDPIQAETLISLDVLHSFDIPLNRCTTDNRNPNNYGNRVLDLCKYQNVFIFNGRLGHDRSREDPTTTHGSVVDYVLGSADLTGIVSDFCVLDFCTLFFDVHRGVSV